MPQRLLLLLACLPSLLLPAGLRVCLCRGELFPPEFGLEAQVSCCGSDPDAQVEEEEPCSEGSCWIIVARSDARPTPPAAQELTPPALALGPCLARTAWHPAPPRLAPGTAPDHAGSAPPLTPLRI
jgi:hypothetical protein